MWRAVRKHEPRVGVLALRPTRFEHDVDLRIAVACDDGRAPKLRPCRGKLSRVTQLGQDLGLRHAAFSEQLDVLSQQHGADDVVEIARLAKARREVRDGP